MALSLNKIVQYERMSQNGFTLLKNLKKVGEFKGNLRTIKKDYFLNIFNNLTLIKSDSANEVYSVKLTTVYS